MGHNSKIGQARGIALAFRAEQGAKDDALNVVLAWNERLAAGGPVFFSPTIAAALTSRQYWLTVRCAGCDTLADIDLTVVRRPPDMTIRELLPKLRCRHCPGARTPAAVKLEGPRETRPPAAPPDPRDEAIKTYADALNAIAQSGIGSDAIRKVHDLREIAERALAWIGFDPSVTPEEDER